MREQGAEALVQSRVLIPLKLSDLRKGISSAPETATRLSRAVWYFFNVCLRSLALTFLQDHCSESVFYLGMHMKSLQHLCDGETWQM